MDREAQARVARLRWRARRGMRELDAVLQGFVDRAAPALSESELASFEAILDLPDPTLHAYLMGRSVPDDPTIAALIDRIRSSHRPSA
jgi:antitoxin CptB